MEKKNIPESFVRFSRIGVKPRNLYFNFHSCLTFTLSLSLLRHKCSWTTDHTWENSSREKK